ncbi:MAG: hypothetical protein M4579_000342 [Chaenotheca gracillima]|nr:MAG: hypothetical protein M4579_000342 [Chaenotheca gracillima]
MGGDLVLITGGTGFIGSRTLVKALETGYHVRAAIRSEHAAETLRALPSVKPYLDHLEFTIVPDILKEDAYDKALEGVKYILHLASPLAKDHFTDFEKDILEPAIKGTTVILSAAKRAPSVKRVVITSSVVAIASFKKFALVETEEVFNDKSRTELPSAPPTSGMEAYCASKTGALNATDEFLATANPSFDVVNIMPAFVFGPNQLVHEASGLRTGTNRIVLDLLLGNKSPLPNPNSSVHVDDVAMLHVRALDPKIAGNQSFVASSGGVKGTHFEDAIDILKREFPDAVAKGIFSLDGKQGSKICKFDSGRTEEVFGFKFLPYEAQVKDLAKNYIELVNQQG